MLPPLFAIPYHHQGCQPTVVQPEMYSWNEMQPRDGHTDKHVDKEKESGRERQRERERERERQRERDRTEGADTGMLS